MPLMSVCAVLALALAVIGVYGVVSYSVTQRTAEIGVGLTLGASRWDVTRLIVSQALGPVLAGLFAGLALSALVMRSLANQLFDVSPIDPGTFGIVALLLLLLLAGVVASALPARRARRLDPVSAWRAE
jgi:putative ABC transport system permease protein